MPLLKSGSLVDDPWIPVADGEPLPRAGAIIVSLKRWQDERADLIARANGLGVRLAAADHAGAIAADIPLLALIALEFPTFRDGRAYSTARLLTSVSASRVNCVPSATSCVISCYSCTAAALMPLRSRTLRLSRNGSRR